MEAEFEVQRTVKRAELTAFLCFLKRVIGPIKVHVDNKGIIDGLEQVGTKEYGRMIKRIRSLKLAGSRLRRQETEESREKSIRGFLNKFEMEVLRRKKDWGISSEKMCCLTEEGCLREKVTLLENISLCMKKISRAAG